MYRLHRVSMCVLLLAFLGGSYLYAANGDLDLEVEISGVGRVVSNPEGIDCLREDALTGTCSASFPADTLVALYAIPISGETFTAGFGFWDGDCSGDIPACALLLSEHRGVTAQFTALGIPVFGLPMPEAQEVFTYHPVIEPVKDPDPARCRPLAIGEYAQGISFLVGLPPYLPDAIDVYVLLIFPGGVMYTVQPDLSLTPLSMGINAWQQNVGASDIDANLYSAIPTPFFPAGLYEVFLIVTPHGDMSVFHAWKTYYAIFP